MSRPRMPNEADRFNSPSKDSNLPHQAQTGLRPYLYRSDRPFLSLALPGSVPSNEETPGLTSQRFHWV